MLKPQRSKVSVGARCHPGSVTKQQMTYFGFDRPDVEVLVDGTWWPGQLRMWTRHDDGTWTGNVLFHDAEGNRADTFPADHIREDTVDRSRGRG